MPVQVLADVEVGAPADGTRVDLPVLDHLVGAKGIPRPHPGHAVPEDASAAPTSCLTRHAGQRTLTFMP